MIPILHLTNASERATIDELLRRLRLNAADLALNRGHLAEANESVRAIVQDVAERGDAALVEAARRFDDPSFTAEQLVVTPREMTDALDRTPRELRDALERSISQVHEYQSFILPREPRWLMRGQAVLGLRFTPIDSAGLYFPGGKASYPSSLIMLAVPAVVAGVKRVAVCTPPSKYGRNDVVLAACALLKLEEVYRTGGPAGIAALAFGTATVRAVDKIVGPGNTYVQLAKRLVSGAVGIDGYLGPSEVLVIADDTARAEFIASDLLAQAEHDPGSCFLLTTSASLADAVARQIESQVGSLRRREAIEKSLKHDSAIIVGDSLDGLIDLASEFAAEHVNLQTANDDEVLAKLRHAGAVFVGPWSPVAAGDYVAGPSHCLPTNTTARFSSGISVYEFLKRTSVVRYDEPAIRADAPHVVALANAEQLDAHAASAAKRVVDAPPTEASAPLEPRGAD
jgi:histidinol dehydrogenase